MSKPVWPTVRTELHDAWVRLNALLQGIDWDSLAQSPANLLYRLDRPLFTRWGDWLWLRLFQEPKTARRIRRERGESWIGSLPDRWHGLCLTNPGLAFVACAATVALAVLLFNALLSLFSPLVAVPAETQRYLLSASAQAVAALTGITFTAFFISTQLLVHTYSTSVVRVLLYNTGTQWTLAVCLTAVFAPLLYLAGLGHQPGSGTLLGKMHWVFHDNTPATSLALTAAALAALTAYAFSAFRLLRPEAFASWLEDRLTLTSRLSMRRLQEKSLRTNLIAAEISKLNVGVAQLFGDRTHLTVTVGKRWVRDVNHRALHRLACVLTQGDDHSELHVAPVSTLLDATGDVWVASLPPHLADGASEHLRSLLVMGDLPYDLTGVSEFVDSLFALCRTSVRQADYDLAKAAFAAYANCLSQAVDVNRAAGEAVRLDMVAHALARSLPTIGELTLPSGASSSNRITRYSDFAAFPQSVAAEMAIAAGHARERTTWHQALGFLRWHTYQVAVALGDDTAFADFTKELHWMVPLAFWRRRTGDEPSGPTMQDVPFLTGAVDHAFETARARMVEGDFDTSLRIMQTALNSILPDGDILMHHARSPRERELANVQTELLAYLTHALYGLVITGLAQGGLSPAALAGFIKQSAKLIADELRNGIAIDDGVDVFEIANNRFLSMRDSVISSHVSNHSVPTIEPHHRRAAASIVETPGHAMMCHLLFRITLQEYHQDVAGIRSIPYSEDARYHSLLDHLRYAVEKLDECRDFRNALVSSRELLPVALHDLFDRYLAYARHSDAIELAALKSEPISEQRVAELQVKCQERHHQRATVRAVFSLSTSDDADEIMLSGRYWLSRREVVDGPHRSISFADEAGSAMALEEDDQLLSRIINAAAEAGRTVRVRERSIDGLVGMLDQRFRDPVHDPHPLLLAVSHELHLQLFSHRAFSHAGQWLPLGGLRTMGTLHGLPVLPLDVGEDTAAIMLRVDAIGCFEEREPLTMTYVREEDHEVTGEPRVLYEFTATVAVDIDPEAGDLLVIQFPPEENEP